MAECSAPGDVHSLMCIFIFRVFRNGIRALLGNDMHLILGPGISGR
jgi:hypothetical protein